MQAASNVNPLSIKGADVPGFPVGDDLDDEQREHL